MVLSANLIAALRAAAISSFDDLCSSSISFNMVSIDSFSMIACSLRSWCLWSHWGQLAFPGMAAEVWASSTAN